MKIIPTHIFSCKDCKVVIKDTTTRGIHYCPKCNEPMGLHLPRHMRGGGDYNHISDSLAINPDQIAEHRAHFPDIDILPDGRPHFTSVKQQSKYLNATGFYKHPQKMKVKSL